LVPETRHREVLSISSPRCSWANWPPEEATMAAVRVLCPVLRAHVTRITDFEGAPTMIVCAEYEGLTKTCRLKKHTDSEGPLSQLLERVEESTLGSRGTRCDLI
jgi:hypothetical protein